MGVWITCDDPNCPFASNSPKSAGKHTADTGHTCTQEEVLDG